EGAQGMQSGPRSGHAEAVGSSREDRAREHPTQPPTQLEVREDFAGKRVVPANIENAVEATRSLPQEAAREGRDAGVSLVVERPASPRIVEQSTFKEP